MSYPCYCFTQKIKDLHDKHGKGNERILDTLHDSVKRGLPKFCRFQGEELEQKITENVEKAREKFNHEHRDCTERLSTRSRTTAALEDEWNAVKEKVIMDTMLEWRLKHLSMFSKITEGLTEDACNRAVSDVLDDETADDTTTADVVTDGDTTISGISSATATPTVAEEAAEEVAEEADEEAAEDTEENIVSKTVEKTTTIRVDGQEMKIKKRNHCEISGDKPVLEWYIQNKRGLQNIDGIDGDDDDDSS